MKKLLLIIILSALLTLIPITIFWTHHQFIAGLNPFLAVIMTPIFIVIAIFMYRLLFKTFKKYIDFTPDMLFVMGLTSYLILSFILQTFYTNSALDIHLHDTYFVMPRSYPVLFISMGFAIFATIYRWFYNIFGTRMNNTLGYIHFWITFLGISFLLLPMHYVGLAGMPRRYYDYNDSLDFNTFYEQNTFISIPGFLLPMAQLLFLFNFCNSIFRVKR